MTEQPRVRRVADMRLRGPDGWLPLRVYWPAGARGAGVLVDLHDGAGDAWCHELCERTGSVVLSPTGPGPSTDDALLVLGWAADHAAELDADPRRLAVIGPHAENVASRARAEGLPPVDVMM